MHVPIASVWMRRLLRREGSSPPRMRTPHRLFLHLIATLVILVAIVDCTQVAGREPLELDTIRSIMSERCLRCHQGKSAEGDVDLEGLDVASMVERDRPTWRRLLNVLRSQAMPPRGETPLTDGERLGLTRHVEDQLSATNDVIERTPGHVVLRRLNGVEYNYTILDLFGLPRIYVRNYDPRQGAPREPINVSRKTMLPIYMPVDSADGGFDNIGEVLTLPPSLMEHYVNTAHQLVEIISGSAPPSLNSSSRNSDVLHRGSRVFAPINSGEDPYRAAEIRLQDFLQRAFRRPVTEAQRSLYLDLFEQAFQESGAFLTALKLPIEAALNSPNFLFRVEGHAGEVPGQIVRVGDYELASRLSYFLWSTMPDAKLFSLASQGKLQDEAVLEQQVHRMLEDKRAMALSDHFAMQWLQIHSLASARPDPDQFPLFAQQQGHMLLNYMIDEANFLFESVMFDNRSILDFVAADYAYLNEVLAKHYGVYDPQFHPKKSSNRHFVRYHLDDPHRGGVLTMGGVLTATSQSTRTSPVVRGKWVLERLLGTPPPPPPDDVADLEDQASEDEHLSLREKLALHRADAACASCHDLMDPLGLALENYDPIGAWRKREGGQPIEVEAELPGGRKLGSAVDLKTYLINERQEDFVRAFTEQMLVYALGRPLGDHDIAVVREIMQKLKQDDYRFQTLVVEIVKSDPFQYRPTRELSDGT